MAGGTRGQLLPIGWKIALADDPPQLLTQDIVHIVLRLQSGEMQLTAVTVMFGGPSLCIRLHFLFHLLARLTSDAQWRADFADVQAIGNYYIIGCAVTYAHTQTEALQVLREKAIWESSLVFVYIHFMRCLGPAQPHGAPMLYNRQPGIDAFDQLARERSKVIGVYVGQRQKAINVLNGIQMLEKMRKSTPSKNAEAAILGRGVSTTVVHVAQAGFGRLKDLSSISIFA